MIAALGMVLAMGNATLTVMTYNLRFATAPDGMDAWPNRREAAIGLVQKHSPDLLAVQEALDSQILELKAALPDHEVIGVGRDDGFTKGEYGAIFYRRSVLGLREGGTRWISDQPTKPGSLGPGAQIPRVFSWGEFFWQGQRIVVLGAHWDHQSAEARLLGARQMREFAEARKLPSLLMGDFNCTLGDPPLEHLKQGKWVPALPSEGPRGTFTGFDLQSDGGKMIDFIVSSPEWRVVSVGIDRSKTPGGRWPSDHFPVIARLRLGG